MVDDSEVIASHVVEFYKALFNVDQSMFYPNFSVMDDFILSLVIMDDNAMLYTIPTSKAIKCTLFKMDASSAPILDGFSSMVYQHG